MKKVKKIYGVSGMMEYQAIIKIGGKSHLRVNFTEGSATAMGVMPATYTTDNLMFQHAIEHSKEYKSGLIKLLKTMELDEDVVIGCNVVNEAAGDNEPNESNVPGEAGEAEGGDEGNEPGEAEVNDASAETMTPMEFSCNDDARDYFEQEYGLKRSGVQLRTRDAIIATGKMHGIEVIFKD